MIILRIVGWLCFVIGVVVVALDGLVSVGAHHWTPTAFAESWARLDLSSFQDAQKLMGDAISDFWFATTLLVVGFLIIVLSQRPR